MKSARFLPFPGYPTTEGTATALVVVASLLSGVLLLFGLAWFATGVSAFVDAQTYASAPRCPSPPNDHCRDVRLGTVVDAGVALPGLRGEHYEVQVRLTGDASVVTASSVGKFSQGMFKGDEVAVTYWRGALTQVEDHGLVMSTTADPVEKYRNGFIGAAIFIAVGVAAFLHYVRRPLRDLRAGKFRLAPPGLAVASAGVTPLPISSVADAEAFQPAAIPSLGLARWLPGYAVPVVSVYNAARNLIWTALAVVIGYSFAASAHFQIPQVETPGAALFAALYWALVAFAVVSVVLLGPRAAFLIGRDLRSTPIVMKGTLVQVGPKGRVSRDIYMGMNLPMFPATGFPVLLHDDRTGDATWVFAGWRFVPAIEGVLMNPPKSRKVEASYYPRTHALAELIAA